MSGKSAFVRLVVLLIVLSSIPSDAFAGKGSGGGSGGTVHVRGYTRKDGTYVQPYDRRAPGTASGVAPSYSPVVPSNVPPTETVKSPIASPKQPIAHPSDDSPTVKATEYSDSPLPKKGETLTGKIVTVLEGDLVRLMVDQKTYKVRLAAVDAPETGQTFGARAKYNLSKKVLGKTVDVSSQGQSDDGQDLGVVKLDGANINIEMVREGNAWYYRPFIESKNLAAAEKEAQDNKAGLWSEPDPVPPWEWRARRSSVVAGKWGGRGRASTDLFPPQFLLLWLFVRSG
jgi:micrococcal nuclease